MTNNRNGNMNGTVEALLQGLGAAMQQQRRKYVGARPPKTFFAPKRPHHGRPLPQWMGNLDVKCSNHFAPMPATFMRFTSSDKGHPVAHYKCSCGKSQFFALSPEGKAFCLFTK